MRAPIVVAAYFLALAAPALADTISPREAASYVGRTVTVDGTISQVFTDPHTQTTFLDFGAAYPDMDFTAVIFPGDASDFPGATGLNGRHVRITGIVRLYRDRPEIVLNSPDQLETQ